MANMEDIAKVFTEYATLLNHLKWLQENGNLPADTDIGRMAFQGSVGYAEPTVVATFVATMELIKARREELANQPKRPRAKTSQRLEAERAIYEKAKILSTELAAD